MTLKEFALKLREELLNTGDTNNIAEKIKNKTISGQKLTDEQVEIILRYIEYPNYDPQKGIMPLNESDNSSLLSAISTIRSIVKGGK